MKSIYIDSNIPSLFCARPSNDVITYAKQLITYKFWSYSALNFKRYVSDVVLLEVSKGDKDASDERLELIKGIPVLEVNEDIQKLADIYMKNLKIPYEAYYDALHIATSSHYRINYIVTWNLKHIMNADVIEKLIKFNEKHGIYIPKICTPEIFMGGVRNGRK